DGFDEVVLAHGDAAGEDQDVFLEAALDSGAEFLDIVGSVAEQNWLAAGEADLCGQGDTVGVADLERTREGVNGDDFVAGGKNGDARPGGATEFGGADLRGDGELGVAEAGARSEDDSAGSSFCAAGDDGLSGAGEIGRAHV